MMKPSSSKTTNKRVFAHKIFFSIIIYLVVSSICLFSLIKLSWSRGTPIKRKVTRKFENTVKRAEKDLELIRVATSSSELTPVLDEEISLAHRSRGEVLPQPINLVEHEKYNTRISIVISHCDHPVDWIPEFIGTGYTISDITIISKCEADIQGLQSLHALTHEVDILYEDNVGRCDHSYAYWVSENRHKVSKDRSSNELVLFLKDNNYLLPCCRTFDEVFQISIATGFGCFLKPGNGEGTMHLVSSMLHRKSRLDMFALTNYDRTGNEANPNFVSQFRNLKEFREALGIEYPDSTFVPVCYGGMFMARKVGLLKQTQAVWNDLVNVLSRGDNIEEGHFMERLWGSLISGQTVSSMRKLSIQILPNIVYEETLTACFMGMIYTKIYEGFPKQRSCIGS